MIDSARFLKSEPQWLPDESHSLSLLPALIHGNRNLVQPTAVNKRPAERQTSTDLTSSCTSADINDMLLQYIGKVKVV